jgi:hypothetical protein
MLKQLLKKTIQLTSWADFDQHFLEWTDLSTDSKEYIKKALIKSKKDFLYVVYRRQKKNIIWRIFV